MEAITEYEAGTIMLPDLLNRLTYSNNKIVVQMHKFDDAPSSPISDSDNDDDNRGENYDNSNSNGSDSQAIQPSSSGVLCVVCLDVPPNVFCAPCGHVKVCKQCYDSLDAVAVADNTQPKCPSCRGIVTQTFPAFI